MKYKVASWVELLVTELWSNKKSIIENEYFEFSTYFDDDIDGEDPVSPELREYVNSLTEDEATTISYVLEDVHKLLRNSRTKTAFSQALVPLLSNGAVFVSA